MKRILFPLLSLFMLGSACTDDSECPCPGESAVGFEMEDVAYIFEGEEATGYGPYYFFTDLLDIRVFKQKRADTLFSYDYNYCRKHNVIPVRLSPGSYDFLFVANLLDTKMLSWKYTDSGKLTANFHLSDHREPPVYLAAIRQANVYRPVELPVELQMLVSRLELKLVNPPAWITGFRFVVRHIAGKIEISGAGEKNGRKENVLEIELKDTASVYKTAGLEYTGPGEYWVGVNAFPTYDDSPAIVDVKLLGREKTAQFVIEDDRLKFEPGRIIRVSVLFEAENKISVSIEIAGKWEVIDEGKIQI